MGNALKSTKDKFPSTPIKQLGEMIANYEVARQEIPSFS